MNKYMTALEVAAHFHTTIPTIWQLAQQGKLRHAFRLGNRKIYERSYIMQLQRKDLFARKPQGNIVRVRELQPVTSAEQQALDDYISGTFTGGALCERLGIRNRQRLSQVMQGIAYRLYYFSKIGKRSV